jgi:hypothetical protein
MLLKAPMNTGRLLLQKAVKGKIAAKRRQMIQALLIELSLTVQR